MGIMNQASMPMPRESYELTGKRTKELTKRQIRKARISGIVLLLLSGLVMLVFVPAVSGVSTFGLSTPDDAIQLDSLAVPSAGSLWVLSSVLAFLGATQFFRGFQGKTTIILGISFGVFAIALIFGFSESLQQKFALLNIPIPSEFLAMAPYLVTIVVVAGVVGRVRPPAADGQPYEKQ